MFPFTRTAIPLTQTADMPPAGGTPLSNAASLRDAVERLVAALTRNLQTMAGASTLVAGSLGVIVTRPIREVLAVHGAGGVAATIGCAPCTLLVLIDAVLVHALVELLAGGNGREAMPAVERPVTAIDGQYALIVAALAASAIDTDWPGFGPARAQRVEGGLEDDVCGARPTHVAVATVTLAVFGLRGTLRLVLPPAALDLFAAADPVVPIAAPTPDPEWRALLHREVGRAPVRVEAFLDALPLSLGAIAALKPGDTVELAPGARSRVALVCDGQPLYSGDLGLDGSGFCVRIHAPADIPVAPAPPAAFTAPFEVTP